MEIFDIFENFECEDQSSQPSLSVASYPKFLPCYQNSNWFLNSEFDNCLSMNSISEVDLYRACFLFNEKKVEEALKIFDRIYSSTKNNRFHEIMLIDSILQCYIKISSNLFDQSKCIELLESYENLLVDYGDQIQFLRTKCDILKKCNEKFNKSFIDTVCLMCSLSDLPENWLFFIEKPSLKSIIKCWEDFELSILIRCLNEFEFQIDHAKGFVKNNLHQKMKSIQNRIETLSTKNDKIEDFKRQMSVRRQKIDPSQIEDSEKKFQAHDSRVKNKFIEKEDQEKIISKFKNNFPILFHDIIFSS